MDDWQSSFNAVYLRRWKKDKKCFIFRLSNSLFQGNFADGSRLIINSKSPTIIYKPKNGPQIKKNLLKAHNLKLSDPSLFKRIEYLKKMINDKKDEISELEDKYRQ